MNSVTTVIEAAGAIEKVKLPCGFIQKTPAEDDEYNHYLEYFIPGTTTRICYEQTDDRFSDPDSQILQRLLEKHQRCNDPSRQLHLDFTASGYPVSPDDIDAYNIICGAFVFGGALFRDGSYVDEKTSVWELRRLGNDENGRSFIVGHLRFVNYHGAPSPRQACVVVASLPDKNGCGYLWLEGKAQELAKHEGEFLNSVIATGSFRRLSRAS